MSDTIITTGRVTRAKFWPVFLPYLIWLALLVLLSATGGAVLFYLTAAALLPVYLLIIRGRAIGRLHDVGVSAFFYWMLIIVEILAVLLMGGMFAFLRDGAAVGSVAPVLTVILSILLFGFGAVLHVALLVFFGGQYNFTDGLLGAFTIKVALGKSTLSFMLVKNGFSRISFDNIHNNPEACASTPTTGSPSYNEGNKNISKA